MSPSELLATFRNELPDPDLKLYSFRSKIDTFPAFNNLPTFIKDMIWHLARGRTVLATIDRNGVLRSRTPTPVTFRVCMESRESTLKYYRIPSHLCSCDRGLNERFKLPASPLHLHFFDPEVDTLVLYGRNPSDISCYWQYSMGRMSDNLGKVKSLQIKRFDWEILMFKGWKTWSEGPNPYMTYFRCFTGLETLTIVGGGHGLCTTDEKESCKEALTTIFRNFNKIFGSYNVPKVYITMA